MLERLLQQCFACAGLSEVDAAQVAEVLVDANLRGNDSHGVARVPAYLSRLAEGTIGGSERIGPLAGSGPLRRLDAGSALGVLAATNATERAAELAETHGIGLVAVGNSSHLGAAGFYARRLAQKQMIGLVATNGPANMAPHGASESFLGTNALAVAAPLDGSEQLVLDLSCSVVARGKILRAHQLGQPLDDDLAIDADGNPTRDPAAALAGAVLPFAGPKGSGLALAISLMVGLLADASFDYEARSMHGPDRGAQGIGHIVVAIDPWQLADPERARGRVAEMIERLHALRPAEGFDAVAYPGERSERERQTRLEAGIPLTTEEIEAIEATCRRLDYRKPLPELSALKGSAP